MTAEIFYSILLFVSGCIIIHQYQKIKAYEEMTRETANELFLKRWDDEYRRIVATYGSGENFLEAHIADYDIYRSNVLVFISRLQELARGIDRAMRYLENDFKVEGNKEAIIVKLGAMHDSLVSAINSLVEDTQKFVENEEEAHSETRCVKEVLDKLSKEIKEINFYE